MKTLISISKEKNGLTVKAHEYILAYTASTISVFCAFLILVELRGFLNPFMFFASAFILLFFLVCNELMKIKESRKNKPSLKLISSFLFTLFLSITGIFLWTNNSFETNIKLDKETSSVAFNVESKYNHSIDSVNNRQFKLTDNYTVLNDQLTDLNKKRRFSADLDERKNFDIQITSLRNQLVNNQLLFDKSKNEQISRLSEQKKAELNSSNTNISSERKIQGKFNILTYILLSIVAIIEFYILIKNIEIGKKLNHIQNFLTENEDAKNYIDYRNMLLFIYETKKQNDKINFYTIKYSYFSKKNKFESEYVKELYDMYISIGLLERFAEENSEEKSYTIKYDKKEAIVRFDRAFNLILS